VGRRKPSCRDLLQEVAGERFRNGRKVTDTCGRRNAHATRHRSFDFSGYGIDSHALLEAGEKVGALVPELGIRVLVAELAGASEHLVRTRGVSATQ
jgi:hypothetical protein